MANFEVDVFKSCVKIDLHDYSHMTAIKTAREMIKEAYDHGFRFVRLIHGASNIRTKDNGGSIKFTLRSMLQRGDFALWAENNNSKKHKIMNGYMIIELRNNPAPMEREWKEMPPSDY